MEKHLIEKLDINSESPQSLKGNIAKIIKFSNVDGPGNRMAVFFQGCNLNCIYCHNPETIPLISSESNFMTVEDIILLLKKVTPFIEGVTVSGGESTLQYNFIASLFKNIKELFPHLTCFVDTNGFMDLSQKELEELVKVTDNFMLDIKMWDEKKHIEITGKPNYTVLKNLDFLKSINKLYEVRCVVFKENFINNLESDISNFEKTIEEVGKKLKNSKIKLKIIKYRPFGVRENCLNLISSPSNSELEALKDIALNSGVQDCTII